MVERLQSLSRLSLAALVFAVTSGVGCSRGHGAKAIQSVLSVADGSLVRIASMSREKAIEVRRGSTDERSPIELRTVVGSSIQAWRIERRGAERISIINVNSSMCLSVDSVGDMSEETVHQSSCTGAANQEFAVRGSEELGYAFVSADTANCLDRGTETDEDGAKVSQQACVESDTQRFRVELVGESVASNEHFVEWASRAADLEISSAPIGVAIDVHDRDADGIATLRQAPTNGALSQRFRVNAVGQWGYQIVASISGLCVGVPSTEVDQNAAIELGACSDSAGQVFRFAVASENYAIVSASNGKCLQRASDSAEDVAPIEQQKCALGPNQVWSVREASTVEPSLEQGTDTLRKASLPTGRYIGTALSYLHFDEPAYTTTAAQEFNAITPENEMKWSATESVQGNFSFGAADALVAFAAAHGQKVKGHALVWHEQLPSWVSSLPDAESLRAAMTNHITREVSRFRGRLFAWDVVNEAIVDGASGALRDSIFRQRLGDDYIAEAFRIAHAADPKALLFYNDYGIEGMDAKADAAFALAKRLLEQGVPISGIGLEMHVGATGSPSAASIAANIRRIAALGLLVNISELDATVCGISGESSVKFEAQSLRMHDIVAACMSESACIGVSLWGITDTHSWLNRASPCSESMGETGRPWPLLFDDAYQRKPAWYGVLEAILGK
jgi:GH35 family endo-1,4-beta-xylanase